MMLYSSQSNPISLIYSFLQYFYFNKTNRRLCVPFVPCVCVLCFLIGVRQLHSQVMPPRGQKRNVLHPTRSDSLLRMCGIPVCNLSLISEKLVCKQSLFPPPLFDPFNYNLMDSSTFPSQIPFWRRLPL